MSDFAQEVFSVNLVDEMKSSYLDYAMSVIVSRALPDARDGLKPVHRRVMYSMHKNGNAWNKKYVKSATIVGDVMGKYHPHGDSAIYDSLVRMAQDFSLRYPLVDGQGNFGSIDGDSAAAYRYTEARMEKIAHSLLTDIEKETINFIPNYDGSQLEPEVLPSRLPHLLLNGSAGIAVGMATNIPPHNLTETINGCLHLLENPEATVADLMKFIPAPDFPTGALISGIKGIKEAYETGRGKIYIRAKTHIEGEEGSKQSIIVDEIPYGLIKADLLEKIANLVKDKKLEGISGLRDESDKDGIRVVIDVKRGDSAEVVLNNLFQQTSLQDSYNFNMMALVKGQPRLLNLKQMLEVFLAHRREVIMRRAIFELRKAKERAHILEGLSIALANVDAVIELIRSSASPQQAKEEILTRAWNLAWVKEMLENSTEDNRPEGLSAELGVQGEFYKLSEAQAQAILDLRLHRLTGLEQDKITTEFKEILLEIEKNLEIINKPEVLTAIIKTELEEVKEQFSDERKTEILHTHMDLDIEDLIAEENRVITISHEGYIKSQPLADYEAQKRGGKGKSATAVKEEDFVEKLIIASTHETMLCFTNLGKVYWKKVYEFPVSGRQAKGRPAVNEFPFAEGERISAVFTTKEYPENQYLIFATKNGTVKKTALAEYQRQISVGKIAINLVEGDELIDVQNTSGNSEIMLFSSEGLAVRFDEADVRPTGRTATGVRGMRIPENERIIALCVIDDEQREILTITENGFGKRTEIAKYRKTSRGTKGVKSINCDERNGKAICALNVLGNEELMLITDNGTMVRTRIAEIAKTENRAAKGVRLIRVQNEEKLIAAAVIAESEEEELKETSSSETLPNSEQEFISDEVEQEIPEDI